MTFVDIGKN